jgi:hypothetical protein
MVVGGEPKEEIHLMGQAHKLILSCPVEVSVARGGVIGMWVDGSRVDVAGLDDLVCDGVRQEQVSPNKDSRACFPASGVVIVKSDPGWIIQGMGVLGLEVCLLEIDDIMIIKKGVDHEKFFLPVFPEGNSVGIGDGRAHVPGGNPEVGNDE